MNRPPSKSTVLAAAVLAPSTASLAAQSPLQEWYFGESIQIQLGGAGLLVRE